MGYPSAGTIIGRPNRAEPKVVDCYVITGPPCSGKTSALDLLSSDYHFGRFKVRDYALNLLAQQHPIGLALRNELATKAPFPDQLIVAEVDHFLTMADRSLCIATVEGYPRSARQLADLMETLARRSTRLAGVCIVDIGDEAARIRMSHRYICSGCRATYHGPGSCSRCAVTLRRRDDDISPRFEQRQQRYRVLADQMVHEFRAVAPVHILDGGGSAEATAAHLAHILGLLTATP